METVNIYPKDQPDTFVWVAYIVDGEVVVNRPTPKGYQLYAVAVASDPKVVVLEGEDRLNVTTGWTYADGVFSPPPSE
jgi:hypothetical protein